MRTWKAETPGRVPAGARISAGKSGSVDRSLPSSAEVFENWVPVSCMPSPESPAKRMTTSSIFSGATVGFSFSAIMVVSLRLWKQPGPGIPARPKRFSDSRDLHSAGSILPEQGFEGPTRPEGAPAPALKRTPSPSASTYIEGGQSQPAGAGVGWSPFTTGGNNHEKSVLGPADPRNPLLRRRPGAVPGPGVPGGSGPRDPPPGDLLAQRRPAREDRPVQPAD